MALNKAILIFSKAAELGNVKTRLRPLLTDSQCLSLHLALLQDTIAKCVLVDADTILYLSSLTPLPFSPGIPTAVQNGANLGERMQNAFSEALLRYERVVVVGTDSPTISPETLQQAFDGLDTHEMVLGPTEDGGYYLISLKQVIPEIFSDIPWGTLQVLEKTLHVVKHRRVLLLPLYFDVDQPGDLMRLKKEIAPSIASYMRHTRKWLSSFSGI